VDRCFALGGRPGNRGSCDAAGVVAALYVLEQGPPQPRTCPPEADVVDDLALKVANQFRWERPCNAETKKAPTVCPGPRTL
jgi:hypothetical protein